MESWERKVGKTAVQRAESPMAWGFLIVENPVENVENFSTSG